MKDAHSLNSHAPRLLMNSAQAMARDVATITLELDSALVPTNFLISVPIGRATATHDVTFLTRIQDRCSLHLVGLPESTQGVSTQTFLRSSDTRLQHRSAFRVGAPIKEIKVPLSLKYLERNIHARLINLKL